MVNNMKSPYGYHHFYGSFKPILAVDETGISYKGKFYPWKEIVEIKRYDSLFYSLLFNQVGAPVAYIYLNDGEKIRIRGRLLECESKKSDVNFLQGTT